MSYSRGIRFGSSLALLLVSVVLVGCGPSVNTTQDNDFTSPRNDTPRPTPQPVVPPKPSNADLAVKQARQEMEKVWTECTDGSQSALFAKIVPAKTAPNTFTPVLTPPGAEKEYGFYQFSYPITHNVERLRLNMADNQNGLRERYLVSWYTPSYRSWESRTKKWTQWQTGRGREENRVGFLVSTVTLLADGSWKVEGRYNITATGMFVKPDCKEIPGG